MSAFSKTVILIGCLFLTGDPKVTWVKTYETKKKNKKIDCVPANVRVNVNATLLCLVQN